MISIQKTGQGQAGQGQGGFVLLEALISILIFSIGVLSLVGLQSMATRTSTDAQFRSIAGYLVDQKMGEIWVADRASISSLALSEGVAELPGGNRKVEISGDMLSGYLVKVTVSWTLPGESAPHQHVAVTNIHDRCNTVGCS